MNIQVSLCVVIIGQLERDTLTFIVHFTCLGKSAKKEANEFWKNLNRAEIIFQLNEPLNSEYLKYFEIKRKQDLEFNLRPGIRSKNNTYACKKKDINLETDIWSDISKDL